MSQRWPGGLIKPTPITPTGPYQDGSASGVWTLNQMEYWLQQGLWPIAGNVATGVFGGGSTYSNVIDYINISATGNATDFGDLITTPEQVSSCASSTRGLFAGGLTSDTTKTNVVQYITIASTGNATDFGDLSLTRFGLAGCSSATRGLFAGGNSNGRLIPDWVPVNTIDYVTIASTGNATDFGDLQTNKYRDGACSSSTRGVIAGGYTDAGTTQTNTIDYVTIASAGNATDFGDLYTGGISGLAGCSNSTTGLFGGGGPSNVIQYITIATTGNSTDFGDLLISIQLLAACSSPARGVFAGGSSTTNVIQYVTISSVGNATDFGDLTAARFALAGCSNAHGGL